MTTPTPDKQTPDPLTDLIAANIRVVMLDALNPQTDAYRDAISDAAPQVASDLAAVIRAAQGEDTEDEQAALADHMVKVLGTAWRDDYSVRSVAEAIASASLAWFAARANLAAHHDTRPGREQIARAIADALDMDGEVGAIDSLPAADAVLALLGPEETR